MSTVVTPDEVQYSCGDTLTDPGVYKRVPDGHLVQWVNASNHEDLHGPSGHFELYDGSVASYAPVRIEED
jgi:hypothetical protein